MSGSPPVQEQIIVLNVGGQRFATSRHTLTWVPDTFFTSLLSGRIPTVRDDTGAIFIDRDPDVFRVILNYLRTKQVDVTGVRLEQLQHEAQFFGIAPLARRVALCEELEHSACGSVLFHAMIPPPQLPPLSTHAVSPPPKREDSTSSADDDDTKAAKLKYSPCNRGHHKKSSQDWKRECCTGGGRARLQSPDPMRVRIIRGHHNSIAVAYAHYVCVYRMRESVGWQSVFVSPAMEPQVAHVALHTKFGPQATDKVLAVALCDGSVHLWNLNTAHDEGVAVKIGPFSLGVPVDKLFFIGGQLVALSRIGKVGIWHSLAVSWQVQDVLPISCYDTAGSSLLMGCSNGSMYYIDMQKFPLRMKDNDLLVTELYRDPNGDAITALSVYLTPKTTVCGNWIEIAYGTSSGAVRVIVQHPETVGHGPQLFQTYTVHTSPVTRVALTTHHLISVCSEYNHVRSWGVTRFRGMISTQPGSTSLASFKVLTLDSTDESVDRDYTDAGPHGDQEGEQVFVQRVVPDSNQLFVRLASTGERLCTIRSVEGAAVSAFVVHECEGSNRMGSRPRRYLFTGTATGHVQMWDLTTALDQYQASKGLLTAGGAAAPAAGQQCAPVLPSPVLSGETRRMVGGPSPQELLQLIDECDICCNSRSTTPAGTRHSSVAHLPTLDR